MHLLRSLILACALAAPLAAAEDPAVKQFREAMSSGDSTAKRAATSALAGSAADDDVVLPLLVGAVGDRQAREAAIEALRGRTGLRPAAKRGQSHYPGYPSGDSAGDWNTWLSERKREKDNEKKIAEAEKTAAAAKAKAEAAEKAGEEGEKGEEGASVEGEAGSATAAATVDGEAGSATAAAGRPRRELPPPEDLGKLDRVVFRNGSSLICYILTRRTDADGALVSLRVVHPDGTGEETLEAAMIARVEEDVR